jgi:hypothetical protein
MALNQDYIVNNGTVEIEYDKSSGNRKNNKINYLTGHP